ncbi:MAG: hypothetical protein AB7V62_11095 [Thermoleophilia bacterium]
MRVPRSLLAAVVVALLGTAAPALGQTAGVAVTNTARAPEGAAALGPLCRSDTPSFRLWWSDTPGAPGAVAGADGNCATLPPVILDLAVAAEAYRARAIGLGFPAMVGDGPPRYLTNPGLLRALLRLRPASRSRAFGTINRRARGSFLAGLTTKQRSKVLRKLPRTARKRLLADMRRAQRGSPSDFVGGDRRVDVVVDATGVTGKVSAQQTGVSPCRTYSRPRRTFVASWAFVLAPPDQPSPRAVLAHELFHVAQCKLLVGPGTPLVLREGTAEWFAALAEPGGFPGLVGPTSITNGNARAASFCNGFDPGGTGTAPYASWPVWEALDTGSPAPGLVRQLLVKGFPGGAAIAPPASAVIAAVTGPRWVEAVRVAAREVCGNRRSPSGIINLAPELRSYLGSGALQATPTTPADDTIAEGGITTLPAVWGASSTFTSVSVRITSAQAAAEALVPGVVVTTRSGPLTPVIRGGAVVVDIPASARSEGYVPVTVVTPLVAGAAAIRVEVIGTR